MSYHLLFSNRWCKGAMTFSSRVVFQVFIHCDSYDVAPPSSPLTYKIDQHFDNEEIVWSTREHGSTILCGLLVKVEEA